MNGKNKNKGLYRVSVYFNEDDLSSIVKDAEKLGFRRVGIPIKIQKPHGFADEWLANTDGVSRVLKHCHMYWTNAEPARLKAQADAMAAVRAAQEKAKEVGAL